MSKLIDLTGRTMGHWLAVRAQSNSKTRWLCECHRNRLCNRGCMAAPDVPQYRAHAVAAVAAEVNLVLTAGAVPTAGQPNLGTEEHEQ
jgi:hypothetical protein